MSVRLDHDAMCAKVQGCKGTRVQGYKGARVQGCKGERKHGQAGEGQRLMRKRRHRHPRRRRRLKSGQRGRNGWGTWRIGKRSRWIGIRGLGWSFAMGTSVSFISYISRAALVYDLMLSIHSSLLKLAMVTCPGHWGVHTYHLPGLRLRLPSLSPQSLFPVSLSSLTYPSTPPHPPSRQLTSPDFNTLSARLPPPFNLTFPLLQYWDGQPVTYVCKRRADTDAGEEQDQGTVYFAVAFEIVDEEAIEGLKSKGMGKDVVGGDGGGESERAGREVDDGDVD